jgi:hypothetical protein
MGTMITQVFDLKNCDVAYLVVKSPTVLVNADIGDTISLNGEETRVRGKVERGHYTYLVVDS